MSTTENDLDVVITRFVAEHGRPDVVTGWIILTALSTVDEDGHESSGIELIFSGGGLPWVQSLGMVEGARIRLHKQFGGDTA